MTRQGSEGGPGAQRRPRALQGQLLLCAPWLPLPLPSPPLGTKYPCGSWGALPFLGHDLADVEFSPGGLLRSGCLPSGAPWNPAPSGGHPAETGGLPRRRAPLTLSSLHAFLSLLPWRIHHAFCSAARLPTPAPCLLSPCVCVVFPSAHPAARPAHPALASFGASGLCFRQELAAASRWPELGVGSSAAGGTAVRAGPPTGQCGAQPAAGTPRGLHRCLWGQPFRLEAQMQAWEVGWLGPHGGEWRGPRGPWLPSRWSCGAAWLGGPGLLDGAHTLGCLEQRVAGCCGG